MTFIIKNSLLFALFMMLMAVPVMAADELKLDQLRLKLVADEGKTLVDENIKSPGKLSFEVGEKQQLSISFKSEKTLKYAFFTLTPTENTEDSINSQTEATFVFEVKNSNYYHLDLNTASKTLLEALKGTPGKYKATIYAAPYNSAEAKGSISFDIGKLQMQFAKTIEYDKPASFGTEFKYLDEIEHIFRPAQKLPPPTLSYLFTGLILAIWVGVLGYWGSLGLNLSNLTSGSASFFLYSVAFMGALDAWAVLFYAYFTVFNLFQLLGYGSVLSFVTFLVGRQALVEKSKLD